MMPSSSMLRSSVIVLMLAAVACGSKAGPPAPQAPQSQPSGDVETITGAERMGWDQSAFDRSSLATFRFAIYVDDARIELTTVSCANTPGANGFACDSSLPPLTRGAHTLEVAAFVQDGDGVAESPRAAALRVNVVPATTGSLSAAPVTPSDPPAANPLGLQIARISGGPRDPTDAAFTPDGRLFVLDRTARMHVLRDGRLSADDALPLVDVSTAGTGGALALAFDPQFERTHFVYVVYTAATPSGISVFRLARFREVEGLLGERAILPIEVKAAPHPSATLRFGPDGKLYAAFDDGGDPRRIGDLSSYNGKILRLNPDGSSPADQPGFTPLYAEGESSPRALAWRDGPGTLWVGGGNGLRAVDRPNRASIAHANATVSLVALANVSAMTFYRAERIAPLRGSLLAAAPNMTGLLRVSLDDANPARIATAQRLIDTPGIVQAIAVGPDGAIYACSTGAIQRIAPVR